MRCKVGDLAIRVSNAGESLIPIGAVVEVVKWIGVTNLVGGNQPRLVSDAWVVKYQQTNIAPCGRLYGLPDSELRPIRPSEGQDESLSWLDVPQVELA